MILAQPLFPNQRRVGSTLDTGLCALEEGQNRNVTDSMTIGAVVQLTGAKGYIVSGTTL